MNLYSLYKMESVSPTVASPGISSSRLDLHQEISDNVMVELTFVSTIPKECLCTLCKHLMSETCHVTCCGSTYCQKCIGRMSVQSCPCTKCNAKRYTVEVDKKDQALEKLIQGLRVYCPMKANGCLWSGIVSALDNHIKLGEFGVNDTSSCRFFQVKCPRNCGASVRRRDMDEHIHLDCDMREVKCEYCGLFKNTAMHVRTVHHSTCSSYPIDCPNGCKMPGLKRSMLSSHIIGECPLRSISCDYQSIGCDAEINLRNRDKHYQDYLHEHMSLMSEKLISVSQENEELHSLCHNLQKTCDKLEEQYNFLFSLCCDSNNISAGSYLVVERQGSLRRISMSETPPPLPPRDNISNSSLTLPPQESKNSNSERTATLPPEKRGKMPLPRTFNNKSLSNLLEIDELPEQKSTIEEDNSITRSNSWTSTLDSSYGYRSDFIDQAPLPQGENMRRYEYPENFLSKFDTPKLLSPPKKKLPPPNSKKPSVDNVSPYSNSGMLLYSPQKAALTKSLILEEIPSDTSPSGVQTSTKVISAENFAPAENPVPDLRKHETQMKPPVPIPRRKKSGDEFTWNGTETVGRHAEVYKDPPVGSFSMPSHNRKVSGNMIAPNPVYLTMSKGWGSPKDEQSHVSELL